MVIIYGGLRASLFRPPIEPWTQNMPILGYKISLDFPKFTCRSSNNMRGTELAYRVAYHPSFCYMLRSMRYVHGTSRLLCTSLPFLLHKVMSLRNFLQRI